jgi:hypothetical protein
MIKDKENILQYVNDKAIESAKNFIKTKIFILSLPAEKMYILRDENLMNIFRLEFNNYLYKENLSKYKL